MYHVWYYDIVITYTVARSQEEQSKYYFLLQFTDSGLFKSVLLKRARNILFYREEIILDFADCIPTACFYTCPGSRGVSASSVQNIMPVQDNAVFSPSKNWYVT